MIPTFTCNIEKMGTIKITLRGVSGTPPEGGFMIGIISATRKS